MRRRYRYNHPISRYDDGPGCGCWVFIFLLGIIGGVGVYLWAMRPVEDTPDIDNQEYQDAIDMMETLSSVLSGSPTPSPRPTTAPVSGPTPTPLPNTNSSADGLVRPVAFLILDVRRGWAARVSGSVQVKPPAR